MTEANRRAEFMNVFDDMAHSELMIGRNFYAYVDTLRTLAQSLLYIGIIFSLQILPVGKKGIMEILYERQDVY